MDEAKLALWGISRDQILRDEIEKREFDLGSLEAQRRKELGAAVAEARAEALTEGLRNSVEVLCEALDIELDDERRARITRAGADELEQFQRSLATGRRWPD